MNVNDIQVPGSDAVWRDLRKRIDDLEKRLTDTAASIARFGLDIRDRRGNGVIVTDKETGYGLSAPRAVCSGWISQDQPYTTTTTTDPLGDILWTSTIQLNNPYLWVGFTYQVAAGTVGAFTFEVYGHEVWASPETTGNGVYEFQISTHELDPSWATPDRLAGLRIKARVVSGTGTVGALPYYAYGSDHLPD